MTREKALNLARLVGRDNARALEVNTVEILAGELWWLAFALGDLDEMIEPEGPLTEQEARSAWEEGLKEVAYAKVD